MDKDQDDEINQAEFINGFKKVFASQLDAKIKLTFDM
jgi:hypothetical protein